MMNRFPLLCLAVVAGFALLSCNKPEEKTGQTPVEKAMADFGKKKYDEALATLLEVEKQEPNSPVIHNLVGAAYTKKKDYAAAKACFEKALEHDPNFFPARFNIGELLFLQKQYPQALGFFADMLRAAPGNELLQFKVVLSLLMTDQVEDARKVASRMKFPGDGPAWYYAHAAVERKEGHKSKASEYLAGARTFFPDSSALYNETFEDLGWPTK